MDTGRIARGAKARTLAALSIALVAWLALGVAAGAAGTDEATTFGADGVATQNLGEHLAKTGISSLSARADGGLVAQQGSRLKSFSADGAPDPAVPTRDLPEGQVYPAAGGKSFVLGRRTLTRLEPDGTVDASFGDRGSVEVPPADSVAELASGKVVVFGIQENGTNRPENTGVITVLNADGSAVPGGRSSRTLPSISAAMPVREMISTSDGGLLIVDSLFLLKLGADGSPDSGFGRQGIADQAASIAGAHVLADGTIEAAALQYISSERREVPAVLRLTAAGVPEEGFGVKGVHVLELPNWWEVDAVSWGPDGSAVIGGREVATGCPRQKCEEAPVLVGVDPAGNLDPGFGQGGVLRIAALAGPPGTEGSASEGVTALTRRPDGSIVAAGNAPPNLSVAFLAAFTPRGEPISSFGEGGLVRLSEPVPATERLTGLVALVGGKLLAVGSTDVGDAEQAMLVRYDADGSLDPSFGNGSGWVSLAGYGRESGAIAVRGGRALVAPYRYPESTLLMVHADDGSPVGSFGTHGLVRLPRPGDFVGAPAFASDGDPVVLDGAHGPDDIKRLVLQRYRRDGRPDPSFGKHGQVSLRPPGDGLRDATMVTVPGGRVLVGGHVGDRLVVGRLLPDGKLDPRFGSHGWSTTRVPGRVKAMAIAKEGSRILLAGTFGESVHHLALVRLDADGRPDNSFGHDGIRSASVGSGWGPTEILPTSAGTTVLLQRGDRPVVTFLPGGAVRSRPVAGRRPHVWQVQGTVSRGRLIVGWSPLDGLEGSASYYLSSLPLRP